LSSPTGIRRTRRPRPPDPHGRHIIPGGGADGIQVPRPEGAGPASTACAFLLKVLCHDPATCGVGDRLGDRRRAGGGGAVAARVRRGVNYSGRRRGRSDLAEVQNLAPGDPCQASVATTPRSGDGGPVPDRVGRAGRAGDNAGTTHFIPHTDLAAVTDAVWDEIFQVNLKGRSTPAGRRCRC